VDSTFSMMKRRFTDLVVELVKPQSQVRRALDARLARGDVAAIPATASTPEPRVRLTATSLALARRCASRPH
jgi:hypothetical protein